MSVPLFKLSVSISRERLIDSKLVSLEIGVRASDIVEVHDQEMKGGFAAHYHDYHIWNFPQLHTTLVSKPLAVVAQINDK